eukprot:403375418
MRQSQSIDRLDFKAVKEDFDNLMLTLKEQKSSIHRPFQGGSILDSLQQSNRDFLGRSNNSPLTSKINLNKQNLDQLMSLPKIKNAFNTSISQNSNYLGKSLQLERNPSQTVLRSIKLLVDDQVQQSKKSETLYFNVRAPWRNTNPNTSEPLNKNDVQPLSPRNMKARDIFIESNLILPRSLNDVRLNEKTPPFKLNTRYDHREFEVPPDSLMKNKAKLKLKKRMEHYDVHLKKKMEEEEQSIIHKRSLNAIKSILECQTPREEREILEKTLEVEKKYRQTQFQKPFNQEKTSLVSLGTTSYMQNIFNQGTSHIVSLRGSVYGKSIKKDDKNLSKKDKLML